MTPPAVSGRELRPEELVFIGRVRTCIAGRGRLDTVEAYGETLLVVGCAHYGAGRELALVVRGEYGFNGDVALTSYDVARYLLGIGWKGGDRPGVVDRPKVAPKPRSLDARLVVFADVARARERELDAERRFRLKRAKLRPVRPEQRCADFVVGGEPLINLRTCKVIS